MHHLPVVEPRSSALLCSCVGLCIDSAFYCDGGKYTDGEFHLTDSFSAFSNYITVGNTAAEAHSVAAPGSCINSTFFNNGYGVDSGCSFAAPHVSGVVALCFGKWASVEGRVRATDGPCMEAFATGGAPAVVKLLVQNDQYRMRGDQGFRGDRDQPVDSTCGGLRCRKHYGYLINAKAF
jgi:subtilisin family serine protease